MASLSEDKKKSYWTIFEGCSISNSTSKIISLALSLFWAIKLVNISYYCFLNDMFQVLPDKQDMMSFTETSEIPIYEIFISLSYSSISLKYILIITRLKYKMNWIYRAWNNYFIEDILLKLSSSSSSFKNLANSVGILSPKYVNSF